MKQPMRVMARICLSLLATDVGGPALAQSEPQFDGPPVLRLMLCRKIKDDAPRLRCFDEALQGLDKPAPSVTAAPATEWSYDESKSPIDDSPQIVASLLTTKPTEAGIAFRCKDRKIEGFFYPDKYLGLSASSVRVIYRINDAKPVEVRWSGSSNGRAAFFNNPTAFLQSLPDDAKLFIRVHDFQGSPIDAMFSLGKVSEASARVLAACPPPASKVPPRAKEK